MVAGAPSDVCRRRRDGPLRPVEPQQRHRGVCVCVTIYIRPYRLLRFMCVWVFGVLRGSAAGASAPTTHPNTPPTSSPAAQTAAKPLPRRGQDARSPQIPRWAFPRSARFKSRLVTSPHLGPRPAVSIPAATVRHQGNLRTPPPPPHRPSCGSRTASPQ